MAKTLSKTGDSKPCSMEECQGTMDRWRAALPPGFDEIGSELSPPGTPIYLWRCRENEDHIEIERE